VPTSFKPPAGSPVAQHGQIRVQGSQLVDEHGVPVRLRGMSMFWSQWGGKYWNDDVVQWLVRDWKISVLRAPMGVEDGGYLEGPESERQTVTVVVDAAIRAGIYVIIDWHDHHAEKHEGDARKFFDKMAKNYGRFPNVFFEIFNEPVLQSWLHDIRPYEQDIVKVIRKRTNNLIICGTRLWSQEVDVASEHPLESSLNVAYTLHFYAASHREGLRQKARAALGAGVALFVTEWGTCSADGDGDVDLHEARLWLNFLAEHNISDANWAVGDKDEACSALVAGASEEGGWASQAGRHSVLTRSGRFARESLRAFAEGRDEKVITDGASQPCRPSLLWVFIAAAMLAWTVGRPRLSH